jgi:putative phage-type endonuclease
MTLTAEQHAERLTGLGASDALAYCAKDPRKTPLDLYLEKIGEAPAEEEREPNTRPGWGSRLEPVVRDWLAEELGRAIFTSRRAYRSTEVPFMLAHLDGMTQNPMEGVEIKTADKYMAAEFGEVGTDQVPVRYVLQVTHAMIVTRLRRFHLAALVGGNDARRYIIDFDPALADMLVERARVFWHHVETRTPPDAISLLDADKRWPRSLSRAVIASEAIASAITDLKQYRKDEAEAAAKADGIEVTLKAFMGEADALTDERHRLLATWRTQERDRFEQRAFAKDHPDLVAQYRATSSFRVFRLK